MRCVNLQGTVIFVTDSKYTKKILFISFYIVILQGNQ